MKKFRVTATMFTYLETEIEARDQDHALEIASEMDGGEFSEIPNSGDWDLCEAFEIEGEDNA